MSYANACRLEEARHAGQGAMVTKLIVLCALVGLNGCNRATAGEGGQAGAKAAVVGLVKPLRKSISRQITVAGSVLAWQKAAVRSRVSGYVAEVKVDLGSRVKKGDVLALVTVPELDAELSAARALAEAEQARSDGADSVGRLASKRFSRLHKLSKHYPGAVAADRVDSAETHRVRSRSAQRTAAAHRQARLAEVQRVETLHGLQQVKAPFDGVVTSRNIDVGDLVGPTSQSPMVTLVSAGKKRLRFALPEAEALQVVVGQTGLNVSVPATGAKQSQRLQVSRAAGEVDVTTRTVTFEADLQDQAGQWLPGLYTKVVVDLVRKNDALTLPAKALVPGKTTSRVWLCEGGKARLAAIQIGMDDGAVIEVLSG
ncbi:MAG TPA: hypothetical protein DCQ06_00835, partial [Myxococcales bacterium]|nr:hypothetical protein [Myxococcales bacterium]